MYLLSWALTVSEWDIVIIPDRSNIGRIRSWLFMIILLSREVNLLPDRCFVPKLVAELSELVEAIVSIRPSQLFVERSVILIDRFDDLASTASRRLRDSDPPIYLEPGFQSAAAPISANDSAISAVSSPGGK